MQSSTYFAHRAHARDLRFPEQDSTLDVHVTDETTQENINKVKRDGTGRETYKRHNRKVELFIEYIEKAVSSGQIKLTSNSSSEEVSITDLIIPLDLNQEGLDKEDFVSWQKPKRYRAKDIVWHNLQPLLVKAYLSTDKMRYKTQKNGDLNLNAEGLPIFNGKDTSSKFLTSLKFCCSQVNGSFSRNFLFEVGKIVDTCKSGYSNAKKNGQTEENKADPIPFSLLHVMCKYACELGLYLLWAMSLLQWNCIARVKNIAELQFSNFTLHEDGFGVTYVDTKTKKKGEQLHIKHIYAYTKYWFLNCFAALGLYFMHVNPSWEEGQAFIFSNYTTKSVSSASRYGTACRNFVKKKFDLVVRFMAPDNFNPYGFRKGGATHASSNTTSPPPIPSIFHRGEWSMGTVIDIYWRYAEAGDHYLGRMLAGWDCSESDFDTLPPHFTVGLDNEFVAKAMKMCFGNIMLKNQKEEVLPGLLLLLLASVVFHSEDIVSFCSKIPGHPFMSLPLFQDRQLLATLQDLVTTEKTPGICERATGIPVHVEMRKCLYDISSRLDTLEQSLKKVMDERISLLEEYEQRIIAVLEKRALEHNQLTHSNLQKLLNDQKQSLISEMRQVFQEEGFLQRESPAQSRNEAQRDNVLQQSITTYKIYTHGGQKYYFTPKTYALPKKCKLRNAIGFILNGDISREDTVRPFCLWTVDYIPKELYDKFKAGWLPLMNVLLEGCVEYKTAVAKIESASLQSASVFKIFDSNELEQIFAACEKYLTEVKVKYIKNNPKLRWKSWTITSWSTNVCYGKVVSKGTAEDIANLPPPTRYNRKRKNR